MLSRVYGVSDPTEVDDPEYVAGLREAVAAALDYGLSGVERDGHPAPIPPVLFVQARQAARNGVRLDTVLRRYFAGYTLLGDFIMQEAAHGDSLEVDEIHRLGKDQATLFDRLVPAVAAEYEREMAGRFESAEGRRAERVQKLLAGEMLDLSEFGYDFSAWHLGMLAVGAGAEEAIRRSAAALDRRLLLVRGGSETAWAWLGGRHRVDPRDLGDLIGAESPTQVSLAIGEPGEGLTGWRLTHRQARAALPVAMRSPRQFVCYADVALLASAMQDDLLALSLGSLYLAPLDRESDGGQVSLKTLRAYFAAERNVSSAAAILGVSRRTVANRLRRIEDQLGHSLSSVLAEVEVALRLEDLAAPPNAPAEARLTNR